MLEFEIDTDKTPEEVLQIIKDNTRKETSQFYSPKKNKLFEGEVFLYSFKIFRVVNHRTILPILTGKVETFHNGSKVNVKARPHPFITIFLLIWISFQTLHLLAFTSISPTPDIAHCIYWGSLLVLLILVLVFLREYKKAKSLLENLLK